MSDLLKEVIASSLHLPQCEPLWLKERREPTFATVEPAGIGPEMLLLHGLFGALSNWDSLLPIATTFSKPIALSFPLVTSHRSEVKVGALAAYTEYFIRKRNLAPAILCGNSLGGHVALRTCLASPQLVKCLILAGTSGLYEHTVDALPIRPDRNFIKDHMSRVFYDKKFITHEAIEDIYKIISVRANVLNIIHSARSAKRDNLEKLLPKIKVPTLLLWGEDDEVTTMDVAHQFNQLIPNSKLVTIPGCGHAPMIEKPEWFAEQVKAFLRSVI